MRKSPYFDTQIHTIFWTFRLSRIKLASCRLYTVDHIWPENSVSFGVNLEDSLIWQAEEVTSEDTTGGALDVTLVSEGGDVTLAPEDGAGAAVALLLVLEDDLPHAEVEHGADVDDEQQGAHHRQGQHWEGENVIMFPS